MTIHWAHVDKDGAIVSWGTAQGTDVFLQNLPPNLVAVGRPEDVTGYSGHRFINNTWSIVTTGENT